VSQPCDEAKPGGETLVSRHQGVLGGDGWNVDSALELATGVANLPRQVRSLPAPRGPGVASAAA